MFPPKLPTPPKTMETLSSQILQNPSHRQPPSQSRPYSLPPPPPNLTLEDKISPSILLIIIILAIIFFVSGFLHLLLRFLFRPHARHPDDLDHDVTALQGQLQQLFHLHDAGVDQSFIETLPVFHYKAIIGVKDPFDCAVCLCEFEPDNMLRLLPKCSHAFHMECIDTWLLSHSTCPLCRASLLPDFSSSNGACTPIICILEAGGDSSRELGNGVDIGRTNSSIFGSDRSIGLAKEPEISLEEGEEGGKIVTVKLGKLKNVDGSGESSSNNNGNSNNVNSRRCFSMGSFAYVMDETTSLQVSIMTPAAKKQRSTKKTGFLPLKPGHKSAISEYGSDSRRDFSGINSDTRGKGKSFSISKRAFSFRFPIRASGSSGRADGGASGAAAAASRRRTISEVEDMAWWENAGSEMNLGDEETQSCYSVESSSTSYRRTLLWLMGRQQHNKVIHSSSLSSSD